MSIFRRRRAWTPAEIPDLAFDGPTRFVDIGFLGGDAHREAFAAIFARMIDDNRDVLEEMMLAGVEAKRPTTLFLPPDVTLPHRLVNLDPVALAFDLYDSENEQVLLRLLGRSGEATLGMRFDDPEFWLDSGSS